MEQQNGAPIPSNPVNTAQVFGSALKSVHDSMRNELANAYADQVAQNAVIAALNENLTQDNARLAETVEKLEAEIKRLTTPPAEDGAESKPIPGPRGLARAKHDKPVA